MRTFELGEVLAERSFVFEAEVGWSRTVEVKIGLPVQDHLPPATAWVCPFQILGLERDRVMGIFGVDALQALILAIHSVPLELAAFARETPGRFLWHGRIETTLLSGCRTALEFADEIFPDRELNS